MNFNPFKMYSMNYYSSYYYTDDSFLNTTECVPTIKIFLEDVFKL